MTLNIKNMKNILISIAILFSTAQIYAQEMKLPKAFEESYTYEYNLEYGKAINTLEKIYLSHIANYDINLRLG